MISSFLYWLSWEHVEFRDTLIKLFHNFAGKGIP